MNPTALDERPATSAVTDEDPFDLDIRVIEIGDSTVPLINLTDDGCGSTCPKACATSMS